MDATYRSDLRELNELNFARFDAKLEQRLAELRAELRGEMGELRTGLAATKASLIKWTFAFTAGWAAAVIGALKYWR